MFEKGWDKDNDPATLATVEMMIPGTRTVLASWYLYYRDAHYPYVKAILDTVDFGPGRASVPALGSYQISTCWLVPDRAGDDYELKGQPLYLELPSDQRYVVWGKKRIRRLGRFDYITSMLDQGRYFASARDVVLIPNQPLSFPGLQQEQILLPRRQKLDCKAYP
jgi:hypothetical protein